ncbi:hypothetical protein CASFOL_011203 [Castilleja foliolosa]|uniref:Uncharacterized protein n=1 Tax=Castilleja foliolosa TaxID=1961234 RepID=A0ABD3DV80_9LAMI
MLNNATRMAVGMSDRAYQSDARPDMKALNNYAIRVDHSEGIWENVPTI